MKEIHIGSIIQEKVKEQNVRIADFANELHCNRNNVYNIFARKNIDMELLRTISKILSYDFLSLYQDEKVVDDYIALIETNEQRLKEMQADNSIRILHIRKESK